WRAEVLAPVSSPRASANHPELGEQAGGRADTRAAGLKRRCDFLGGLLRWVANEQPAPHPAGQRRHAHRAKELAHSFDERYLQLIHAPSSWVWITTLLLLRSRASDVAKHRRGYRSPDHGPEDCWNN